MNTDIELRTKKEFSHLKALVKGAFVGLGLILIIGFLGAYIKRNYFLSLPFEQALQLPHPESLMKHVRIAEQDLLIPVLYFKSAPSADVQQEEVLLISLLPDLNFLEESPQKIWEKGEWDRNIMILVADAKKHATLGSFAADMKKYNQSTRYVGKENGLDYYTHPLGQKNERSEIFSVGDEANPRVVILCDPLGSGKNPQCNQFQIYNGLALEITYDRINLPKWQSIGNKTTSLIEKFHKDYLSK